MARQQRIALVIGNSAYQNSKPLPNPVNDAALITRALARRGFEIVGGAATDSIQTGMRGGMNLTSLAMEMMFALFRSKLQPGALAVIYYAGHGLQVGDKNYLVPVDDTLEGHKDLGLLDIKAQLEGVAAAVKSDGAVVLFLDACRDGPLSDSQKKQLLGLRDKQEHERQQQADIAEREQAGDRLNPAVAETRGRLGAFKVEHKEGSGRTFIGFATAPGDVSLDGKGSNSAFATALDTHLAVRGLHIEELYDRVGRDVTTVVARDFKGRVQDPWSETNLNQKLYLHPSDAQPIWVMGATGLLAGLVICMAIFKGGRITTAVPLIGWMLGLGFGLVMVVGTLTWGSGRYCGWGTLKKWRDMLLAFAGPGIGFALALAIMQIVPALQANVPPPQLNEDRGLASGIYWAVTLFGGALYLIGTALVRAEKKEPWPRYPIQWLNLVLTWLLPFVIVGVLLRLEMYMSAATPVQTAIAMFAVLGGVIYAGSVPLALRAQGGNFSQFGPFTGAVTVGLLMAGFFAGYQWIMGNRGATNEESQMLLVALGTAWHGLLGAQIGYCFAYFVPDYRAPTR